MHFFKSTVQLAKLLKDYFMRAGFELSLGILEEIDTSKAMEKSVVLISAKHLLGSENRLLFLVLLSHH